MNKDLDNLTSELLSEVPLQQATQNQIINKLAKSRVRSSPFQLLPNVSKFEIILKSYNSLFALFSFKKRLEPEIKVEAYRNKRLNRFIEHQITRLEKHIKSPEIYFRISKYLLERSDAFMILAFHHISPRGYKEYSRAKIHGIITNYISLRRNYSKEMQISRVYVDKIDGQGNKTYRPLGVSNEPTRMLQHLAARFLTWYVKDKIHPEQHGFIPGKGAITAGQSIFKRLDSPNIYEYDFKKYFDNVKGNGISKRLNQLGIPPVGHNTYFRGMLSLPPIPKDKKIDETDLETKHGVVKALISSIPVKPSGFSFMAYVDRLLKFEKSGRGTPQGSPISPIMANLAIDFGVSRNEVVQYADDGIGFPKEVKEMKDGPNRGIELNHDKSKWVKKDGIGLSKLKFLGMVYDPGQRTWTSETRKGAKVEITPEAIDLITAHVARPSSNHNKVRIKSSVSMSDYNKLNDLLDELIQEGISKKQALTSWMHPTSRLFERLEILKPYLQSKDGYINLTKSNISGGVLANLYHANWMPVRLPRPELKFAENSFLNQISYTGTLTIENASSVSIFALSQEIPKVPIRPRIKRITYRTKADRTNQNYGLYYRKAVASTVPSPC